VNRQSVQPEIQALVDAWANAQDRLADCTYDLLHAPFWKMLWPPAMEKLHRAHGLAAQVEHHLWMKLMAHGVEMRSKNGKE
jgi:hypothetical protein